MRSALRVTPVLLPRDLSRFVEFPYWFYRADPTWIPPLRADERRQFDPGRNPAFEHTDAQLFLARRGDAVVGRVAALVSHPFIQRWNRRCGRFGWFECERDEGTASALIAAAEAWVAERGMEEISGPLGFTDFDPTGFLVEGFGELPTIAGSYNPPYYNDFITALGYVKEIEYVEYRTTVPAQLPEKVSRLAEVLAKRSGVRVFSERSRKELVAQWGPQLFQVLNRTYAHLYGTTELTERQIEFYVDGYLGHVDPEFIKLAVHDDRLVGFVVAMPNLSRAFQKARGRLFPLGFLHILRAMKTSTVLDFYLAGVLPEYRNRGIDLMLAYEMGKSALARGMTHAESNREIEENAKIQAQWKLYEKRLHRRSRVYTKRLS
ncbi:hypothetical protein JXA88_15515 [Candidatus Fermentibacteria bacterium]|nr:hypothetical protein [Candidatus Fermentibacteria bacterium]